MNNGNWLLVLGANSDIALAISKRYAKEGFNIYLASRDIHACERNACDIRIRYKVKVKSLFFDACDYSSHQLFYSELKSKPLGVVLAFGVMNEQQQAQTSFVLAKDMIDTNYSGSVSICEEIAKDFEKRRDGFIVGISSVAGDRGRMSNYLYGSSKAAFSSYLSGLAHRLSKFNVLVLIVKPGFVETKMTHQLDLPSYLTAKPKQVANSVYKGVLKKKSIIYILPIWRLIMWIIKNIPSFLLHKTNL